METFSNIWNYPFTIGANQLTVGTILIALVLIILGYIVSRALSKGLSRALVRKFTIESGQASALETFSFYLFFVGVVVTALRVVDFPLTIFTIAGGALAIGVGFGSQELMNNFISGLILLMERPVRVGDLVELGGTYGHIEAIGARSTRVLASNNTHIIVPNSFFLQTNVINYTLSDDVMRTVVKVGVAYGSPVREVERILKDVLRESPNVMGDREPRILFASFGDSALEFEMYFWLHARSIMERLVVESEIRYRIDDLFRKAGITIAFPQRDLHLDTLKPLDIRMVAANPGNSGGDSKDALSKG